MPFYSRHDSLRLTSELNYLLKEVAKHQEGYYYNRESEVLFYHGDKVADGLDGAYYYLDNVLVSLSQWKH